MNVDSLKRFTAKLRQLPQVAANKIAAASAPEITRLGLETFDAGENPYGVTWAPGVHGDKITLRGKSGKLLDSLKYVAIGTILRVVVGVSYAKYQIGKRPVFPRQSSELPTSYVRALTKVSGDVVADVTK